MQCLEVITTVGPMSVPLHSILNPPVPLLTLRTKTTAGVDVSVVPFVSSCAVTATGTSLRFGSSAAQAPRNNAPAVTARSTAGESTRLKVESHRLQEAPVR
jgi:hypothetical protein